MSVKITCIDHETPTFSAVDLATGEEISCKNWFEKSKNKWHVILGANSANRKYVAHNEILTNLVEDTYIVEDKTTGPRQLGVSQPDKKLIPFMTEEDKLRYDEIIARALENKRASTVAKVKTPLTEEEKLNRRIAALMKKRDELLATAE